MDKARAEQVAKEYARVQKEFHRSTEASERHIRTTERFISQIQGSFSVLGQSLASHAQEFFNETSVFKEEQEQNIRTNNYLYNFVLNLSDQLTTFQENLRNEVLLSYGHFQANFQQTNASLNKDFGEHLAGIEAARAALQESQKRYYRCSKQHEKHQKTLDTQMKKVSARKESHEEVLVQTTTLLELKNNMDFSHAEYSSHLETLNRKWDVFDEHLHELCLNFDNNEQSRYNMNKITVSMLVQRVKSFFSPAFAQAVDTRLTFKYQSQVAQSDDLLPTTSILKKIRSKIKKNNALDPFEVPKLETYQSYEEHKKTQHMNQLISLNSAPRTIDNRVTSMVLRCCRLTEQLATSPEAQREYALLMKDIQEGIDQHGLEQPQNTKYFLNNLVKFSRIDRGEWEIKGDLFEVLGVLGSRVLGQYEPKEDKNGEVLFWLVLLLTRVFLRKGQNCVVYLVQSLTLDTAHLHHKPIWETLWLKYVQRHLMTNVEFVQRVALKNQSVSQFNSQLRSVGKQLDSDSASPLQKQVPPNMLKKLSPKNTYLRATEDLNQTLISLCMATEFATDLIISLSIKYSIRKTQLMNLIENQEKSNFFNVELIPRSKQNSREWKHQHLKTHCQTHLIKKALPYLASSDLVSVLLLSQQLGHVLRKYVFRSLFRRTPLFEMSLSRRLHLWDLMLQPRGVKIDYNKYKQEITSIDYVPNKQVEDLITQDVQRSFQRSEKKNNLILHNLLRLYAHYDPRISYCQGMNFVMGFLLINLQNEEQSFRMFIQIMRLILQEGYQNNFQSIRMIFYTIDRLITIHLPALAQHLKNEKIDASLYASPWILTLFTSAFQEEHMAQLLYLIWDQLVLDKWKAFYKTVISILTLYQDKLLSMKFEQILTFMNDLMRSEFFLNKHPVEEDQLDSLEVGLQEERRRVLCFRSTYDSIKITNNQLDLFRIEYNNFKNTIQKQIKDNFDRSH